MPKLEIEMDANTLRNAQKYATANDITVEAVIVNALRRRANAAASRKDWHPFANPEGMVRLVLLLEWDPLGVAGFYGAMDEYDSYAEDFTGLLETGATQDELTAHLREIERTRMNIKRERPELREVAATLRRVYDNAIQSLS